MKIILVFLLTCATAIPCEILVKARDWAGQNSDEDRFAWKTGWPVVVKPDGHVWGAEEGLPRFWIIKLPGITVERALQFIVPWDENGTNYSRRLWQFYKADFPAAIQTKLDTVGTITIPGDVTWSQVRSVLRNRKTGANAPANP